MKDRRKVNPLNILAIIPARGGSKSIPRKNIRFFAGKPLIAHTIEIALNSKFINRVIVSTEDDEIANISKKYGAEIPFLRPNEYAQDDTPDWPVFYHALEWLKKNEEYCPDIVIHLRATTPNRKVIQIDNAIKYFLTLPLEIDGLRSVQPAAYSPYKMCLIGEDGCLEPVVTLPNCEEAWGMPRQSLPKVYQGDGYIDIIRPYVILELRLMRGPKTKAYLVPDFSIDIDDEKDFQIAQEIFEKNIEKSKNACD